MLKYLKARKVREVDMHITKLLKFKPATLIIFFEYLWSLKLKKIVQSWASSTYIENPKNQLSAFKPTKYTIKEIYQGIVLFKNKSSVSKPHLSTVWCMHI